MSSRETVLHIAAKMGHTEIVRYLLTFCRPSHSPPSLPRASRKLLDINIMDANNRTPLQAAAEKGEYQNSNVKKVIVRTMPQWCQMGACWNWWRVHVTTMLEGWVSQPGYHNLVKGACHNHVRGVCVTTGVS